MCIKNLYHEINEKEAPDFLEQKIIKSKKLTGDAFFLKVFGTSEISSRVYYEEFYDQVFYKGKVAIRLKELLRLRLAGISGCKYCISVDENSALNNGVTEKEIFYAKNGMLEKFPNKGRKLLELTEHISLSPASERANKSLIKDLLKDFTQEEFIEISFVIAVLTGMGNMLGSLDLVETD